MHIASAHASSNQSTIYLIVTYLPSNLPTNIQTYTYLHIFAFLHTEVTFITLHHLTYRHTNLSTLRRWDGRQGKVTINPETYLPTSLPTYLYTYLSTYPPSNLPTYKPTYLPSQSLIYLPTHARMHTHTYNLPTNIYILLLGLFLWYPTLPFLIPTEIRFVVSWCLFRSVSVPTEVCSGPFRYL